MDPIHKCPHCNITIWIEALNCRIFRCGMYKESYLQINPHMSQEECEDVVLKDLIYGCGKPFCYEDGILKPCKYI